MQTTASAEAVTLVDHMVALGFVPSRELHADCITFIKDLAIGGVRTRIHAFFDKPMPHGTHGLMAAAGGGIGGLRLANFVIATQVAVDPSDLTDAPEGIRAELEAVIGIAPRRGDLAVMTRTCIICGEARSEFYVVNKDAICHTCVEARRAQTNR